MSDFEKKYLKLIKRCMNDTEYYLSEHLKIRTKNGELINFKLNESQKKSIEHIQKCKKEGKPIRVIFLKARQLGISTLCEGLIFQDTANFPLRNSLIVAHEDKATQNLFNMSKLFYENLSPVLQPMKKYSNEQALTFENPTNDNTEKYNNPGLRSKITVATARNVRTSRSSNYNNVHCSEVAFWDDASTLMTGLMQAVGYLPNTMFFIESTANGVGGWFYDFWKRTEKGETDFIPIFLPWFDNPEYSREFANEEQKKEFADSVNTKLVDEKGIESNTEEYMLMKEHNLTYEQLYWRQTIIQNQCSGKVEIFRQEYPSTPEEAFISSGNPVFDSTTIKAYLQHACEPIKQGGLMSIKGTTVFIENNDNPTFKIYKEPIPDEFYIIGADVAEGVATGDYSTACVMDTDYNVVATYKNRLDPDLFGDQLINISKYYNEGLIACECNNHGHSTIRHILSLEYYNMYFRKNVDKITEQITEKPGWHTNPKSKPLMINHLAAFLRDRLIGLKDLETLKELLTYVEIDGKTNAQSGCNDDCVIALAIATYVTYENHYGEYYVEKPNTKNKTPDLARKEDNEDLTLEVSK